MRKACVLAILAFVLSGCSDAPTGLERGMALRSAILQADHVSFQTDIIADYGDSIQIFSMDCLCDSNGNINFTVTAPDTICGITGNLSQGQGKLTFDNTALCIPLLTDEQLNPVSAPWILMDTLRSGYITSAGIEADQLRLSIHDSYEDNALLLDVWLDSDDLPQSVEICDNGRRILTLAVRNLEIL